MADADLPARAGRVRARRRGEALGLRGEGVPRLPGGDLRLLGGPLPSRRRRGGARAGRQADPHLEPLSDRGWRAAGGAALHIEPGRQGVPLQLRDRGQRVRDQVGPQARSRPGHLRPRDRRPGGGLPRPNDGIALSDPGARDQRELRPVSTGLPAGPSRRRRCAHLGRRRADGRRHARADPGGDGGARDSGRAGRRRARSLRRRRRAARLRRDPDRDGQDRLALGLRAAAGASGRDDHGQGAGRGTAGRCLRHERRRRPTFWSGATTARPSPGVR